MLVVRKAIKNLHLGVYPPNGRVRVAVPLRVDDEAVRLAVVNKLGWIRRHQARFASTPRQSKREMVGGESQYFMGRRYRLHVIANGCSGRVTLKGTATMELHVRPGSTVEHRERMLHGWYRQHLKNVIPAMLEKWQPILGVQAAEWGIKKMKTKWGSCNVKARRIWVNLELAKKPVACLEYIVVHELVHLTERSHDKRFNAVMDRHLPRWRACKAELNAAPLCHETWSC